MQTTNLLTETNTNNHSKETTMNIINSAIISSKDTQLVPLTPEQGKEARKLEKIIDNGQMSYVEIGMALKAIQDNGLYVGKFVDYMRDRFDLKKDSGYRTIRAAVVAKYLRKNELPAPRNEAQAHALQDLEPDQQVEVWKLVLEKGKRPTEALVLQVKADFLNPRSAEAKEEPTEQENNPVGNQPASQEAHSLPVTPCLVLTGLDRACEELQAQSRPLESRLQSHHLPLLPCSGAASRRQCCSFQCSKHCRNSTCSRSQGYS